MANYFNSEQWFDSYVAAVRDIVTKPDAFFRELPKATAYGNSLFFFTVTLAVPLLIYVLFSFGFALLIAPFIWLVAVAATWLWAWYLGWAVRTFARQQLDTVNAFQICAYANVPMLLAWLPVVGMLATIWSIALTWFGLTRTCQVSSGSALAILLVPLLLISISGGVLAILVAALVTHSGMQPAQF